MNAEEKQRLVERVDKMMVELSLIASHHATDMPANAMFHLGQAFGSISNAKLVIEKEA